ncbi:hypothetical protein O181_103193 [Austropuccinia psidii MF-1]|uniref:Uncharacterized protein n=1 Tax=Austropuccinia psidii MF-1 TaxID=1389203 RepID=A0A9Q3PIU5_9BASI|nr:hypothetical protein [Austropuccinia psidii MF-1]
MHWAWYFTVSHVRNNRKFYPPEDYLRLDPTAPVGFKQTQSIVTWRFEPGPHRGLDASASSGPRQTSLFLPNSGFHIVYLDCSNFHDFLGISPALTNLDSNQLHRVSQDNPSLMNLKRLVSESYLTLNNEFQSDGPSYFESSSIVEQSSSDHLAKSPKRQRSLKATGRKAWIRFNEEELTAAFLEARSSGRRERDRQAALSQFSNLPQAGSKPAILDEQYAHCQLVARQTAIIRLQRQISKRLFDEYELETGFMSFVNSVVNKYRSGERLTLQISYVRTVVAYSLRGSFVLAYILMFLERKLHGEVLKDAFQFLVDFWTSVLTEVVQLGAENQPIEWLDIEDKRRKTAIVSAQKKLAARNGHVRDRHLAMPWVAAELWVLTKQPIGSVKIVSNEATTFNGRTKGDIQDALIKFAIDSEIDVSLDLKKLLLPSHSARNIFKSREVKKSQKSTKIEKGK